MRHFFIILFFLAMLNNVFSQTFDTTYKYQIWQDGEVFYEGEITPDLTMSFFEVDPNLYVKYLFASVYSNLSLERGYLDHFGYWGLQEITTDELVIPVRGGNWVDERQHIELHTHTWNSDVSSNAWEFVYRGISMCNELLELVNDRFDVGETIYSDSLASVIAEIKIMRAFYHYLAIDIYGNAVLNDGVNSTCQYSRKNLYNWIETEILDNLDKLPKEVNYGRVTRSVAYMILAKLYLNAEIYTGQAQWQKCIDYCDSIINGGYGYALSKDYFDTFKKDNGMGEWGEVYSFLFNEGCLYNADNEKCNREIIFPIISDSVLNYLGNRMHLLTLHYVHKDVYDFTTMPWNGPCTLESFYKKYSDDDKRKAQWLVGAILDENGDTVLYGGLHEGYSSNVLMPAVITSEVSTIEDVTGANSFEGARCIKFEIEPGIDFSASSDFPIYRYADVLLMKAESLMRLNGGLVTSEALLLINEVHTRAGLEPYTEDVTLDELLDERGREFAWEGHRRQDLIRFGKFTTGMWEFMGQRSSNRTIFPIPEYIIEANPEYIQNIWK